MFDTYLFYLADAIVNVHMLFDCDIIIRGYLGEFIGATWTRCFRPSRCVSVYTVIYQYDLAKEKERWNITSELIWELLL